MMLILNVSGQDATSWLARSRRGERLIVIATVLLVARTCPKFHVELFWIEQLSGPPFLTYSWYSLSLLPPRTHQQAALHRYRIFESLRRQSLKRTNSTMQTQQSTATMMTTTTMVSTVNLFFVILFYLLHYNPRERNPLNPYHTAFSLFALVWFHFISFGFIYRFSVRTNANKKGLLMSFASCHFVIVRGIAYTAQSKVHLRFRRMSS